MTCPRAGQCEVRAEVGSTCGCVASSIGLVFRVIRLCSVLIILSTQQCWQHKATTTAHACLRDELFNCFFCTWQMGRCMLVNTLSWQFWLGAVVVRMHVVKGLHCLSRPTKGLNGKMQIRAIEIFRQTMSRASR